jgi:hypothetical protein
MLLTSLEGLRRKVKLLGIAYGVGIVFAVAVSALLAATLLDYVLNLPALPRLVVSLLGLGSVGYVLWQYVLRPAVARVSLSDLAGKLERAFPQFDDRLRSTVDFLHHDIPGSEAMKQCVVMQAGQLASQLDLNRALVARPAWYSLAGGVGAVAALLLLAAFVISPVYRDVALARLFLPFGDHAWPKRVRIDVLGEVPSRVPVGQRLDVRMKLGKGDSQTAKAVVHYQYDDGPPMQEYMTRGADGTYSASLDTRVPSGKVSGSMRVWMSAGDDERHLGAVTVVQRLATRSVEALVTPPAYVPQRQPATVSLAAAPAVVGAGSEIQLRVTFNKPLADGVETKLVPISVEQKEPAIKWSAGQEPGALVGAWTAVDSLRFHIQARDIDGFTNSALEEYELIVLPDQSPSVQIENPRRGEERTAVAVIPLLALAEDDYGVRSLKLVVDRLGDKRHWEIDLVTESQPTQGVSWVRVEGTGNGIASSDGQRQRMRANYSWDLAQLEKDPAAALKPGDVLEYHLRATDNYYLDGQFHDPVSSGKLRITVISQDELTNRIVDELRHLKDQIGAVRNTQERTREETKNLTDETKDKPQLEPADRAAAERLTNQQATGAAQAKALSGRMEQLQQKLEENKSPAQDLKDLARDVKNDLTRAAEGPMKDATQQLTNASQPERKADQRKQDLGAAQDNQSEASDQLQQAMDRMANIGSMAQTIERLQKILEDQKQNTKDTADAGRNNLGKKPEQMNPEDRAKLDKAADEQAKLADRTGKALADMQKMSDQMAKSDPTASEAMKKAAETAKQQQVQPKQQKASQQAKQNQQADAQSNQKQVELGLEMMLSQLREAERARLAELSKKLEELQKQVAILIRRQAGHNLDNLHLQGDEVVPKRDAALLSELMIKAERDPAQPPPKTELVQLTQSQELTERNTRDIGKSAEQLPNGAEPASHLLRAAGKMERAIFALRDRKLHDAYDPPQVEALAALEAAKRIVDEQKNKVDEQISDNDREAVRQKYVKIKEDQEKLNAETARIDGSRDQASKELPRAEAMRLGQLPGDQGKLSDRVSAIDKDLSEVGSIVYLWANKDIVSSMNDVKADLGKPEIGAATQTQQKRIVEQLDAMIKNLATRPRESKFAQDSGGAGQCSGGGPKLPTEAELRLLKALQQIVNRDTRATDEAEPLDKQRTLDLGTRQGELRNLLDQLLQRASNGEMKLGPEPDKLAQLPEEAGEQDVENQELEQDLLNDKPDVEAEEKQAGLIGDRMARSRQRLALNSDPGKVTQIIQDRIVLDLDDLIEQARQQQAQTRNSKSQNKPGQKMNKPGENMAQAQADNQGNKPGSNTKGGTSPAADETAPGQAQPQQDLTRELVERLAEWGKISPRMRDAIMEGGDEQVLEEYRKLVEDYRRSLAEKGTR